MRTIIIVRGMGKLIKKKQRNEKGGKERDQLFVSSVDVNLEDEQ